MTDGLAILAAWLEFGATVGLLLWILLRDAESHPAEEAKRSLTDGDEAQG
jgi:hypothetical protein